MPPPPAEQNPVYNSIITSLSVHDQFAAITDKMHRMEVNHANRFQLLREAFNVPKSEHEDVIRNTKEKILNMAQNFSAEVTVDGKSSYSFDLLG